MGYRELADFIKANYPDIFDGDMLMDAYVLTTQRTDGDCWIEKNEFRKLLSTIAELLQKKESKE